MIEENKEIWKHIKGYEFMYKVSSFGNVKSLDRVNSKGVHINGKELKKNLNGSGYYCVTLSKDGKEKQIRIHQLVAQEFLNHIINGYSAVINHIDFNRLNNIVTNLEVTTQRDNSNKKHLKSSSKFVGVLWNEREVKWQSYIKINGKQVHLGFFNEELEASKAYYKALSNKNKFNGNAKEFRVLLNTIK